MDFMVMVYIYKLKWSNVMVYGNFVIKIYVIWLSVIKSKDYYNNFE